MTETNSLTGRSHLVYLLPLLHLGGCLAIWLTHNLQCMIVIDFPLSILFVVLMYKGVNPVISFGIIGTLWWYLLSLAVRWVVGIVASPRRS
jgi:hypothetical protein